MKRDWRKTHGMSKTRIYREWVNMKSRCKYDTPNRKYYVDKGISVCEEWKDSFENFKDWAFANGYAENLTLDRIDCNKDYSPSNCRWVTPREQSNNMGRNKIIVYKGRENTLSNWCSELSITYAMVKHRLQRGWTIEKAFETPKNTACIPSKYKN